MYRHGRNHSFPDCCFDWGTPLAQTPAAIRGLSRITEVKLSRTAEPYPRHTFVLRRGDAGPIKVGPSPKNPATEPTSTLTLHGRCRLSKRSSEPSNVTVDKPYPPVGRWAPPSFSLSCVGRFIQDPRIVKKPSSKTHSHKLVLIPLSTDFPSPDPACARRALSATSNSPMPQAVSMREPAR